MEKDLSKISYYFNSYPLDGEVEKYLTEINGEIYINNDEYQDILIGKVKYFLMDLHSAEFLDADSLLDTYSNTSAFMGSIYHTDGYSFRKKIKNLTSQELYNPNILILDRIEILAKYRGFNFTQMIIEDGIRFFGNNVSLIVLKAFPLQLEYKDEKEKISLWKKEMHLNDLEKKEKEAFRKLSNYYKKLGFIKIDNERK
ncbi:hypothetical protein [Pectobacterium polaris]|uniref:hypothetical protein n=1 Tax=Pectobacterium polaris TaxID=2042057 RepID=UPI001F491CC6|nr:hypothetical protein [Pectobacterium polaris]